MILIRINLIILCLSIVWGMIRLALRKVLCHRDVYAIDRVYWFISILILPISMLIKVTKVHHTARATLPLQQKVSVGNWMLNYHKVEDVLTVFLFVGFMMFLVMLVCYLRKCRILSESCPINVIGLSKDEFSRSLEKVWVCEYITSPMVWGIMRPKILVPPVLAKQDDEQENQILLHEWVHLKRRDNLMKCLVLIHVCMFWCHPFLWLLYAAFQREAEMSCDEAVISYLGENRKMDYACTLLEFASGYTAQRSMISQLASGNLKRRIMAVTNYKITKKKFKIFKKLSIGMLVVLCGIAISFSTVLFADTDRQENVEIVKEPQESAFDETVQDIETGGKERENSGNNVEQDVVTMQETQDISSNKAMQDESNVDYRSMTLEELEKIIDDPNASFDDNWAEALHTYNRKYFGLE